MESLPVEKAYAKINLGLKILGRRPDGYHEILSVGSMRGFSGTSCTLNQLPPIN